MASDNTSSAFSRKKLSENEKVKLWEALENSDEKCAISIIDSMSDINESINEYDNFALMKASECGLISVVNHLISLGADLDREVDSVGGTALMSAISAGRIEIVQLLINAGANVNFRDLWEQSAFSSAGSCGRVDIVNLLINAGVDLSLFGGDGLLNASRSNHEEVVKVLVEKGVNVNFVDSVYEGLTSLHYACMKNNLSIVEILMNNGANPGITNNNGKTPIELTENETIKEFIKSYDSTKYVLK